MTRWVLSIFVIAASGREVFDFDGSAEGMGRPGGRKGVYLNPCPDTGSLRHHHRVMISLPAPPVIVLTLVSPVRVSS